MLGFAVAAGIALLTLFAWPQRPVPATPELVARVATLTGDARLEEGRAETVARVMLPIPGTSKVAHLESNVAAALAAAALADDLPSIA